MALLPTRTGNQDGREAGLLAYIRAGWIPRSHKSIFGWLGWKGPTAFQLQSKHCMLDGQAPNGDTPYCCVLKTLPTSERLGKQINTSCARRKSQEKTCSIWGWWVPFSHGSEVWMVVLGREQVNWLPLANCQPGIWPLHGGTRLTEWHSATAKLSSYSHWFEDRRACCDRRYERTMLQ